MNRIPIFKKIYFVGIKGVAMTSLALFLKDYGVEIRGSDVEEMFPTDMTLQKNKIKVDLGFLNEYIEDFDPDMVIYTGAHNGIYNPQVKYSIDKKIKIIPHGQALGFFMRNFRQISVCGSHGKTTTSAMLATIFSNDKLDSSFTVGCGSICPIGNSGHAGSGNWFIAEADEYITDPNIDKTPRFMWQNPEIMVVTNIDYDHPDAYKNISEVINTFRKFADKVPKSGKILFNGDDFNSKLFNKYHNALSVGFSRNCDYQINIEKDSKNRIGFILLHKKITTPMITLQIPGIHNIRNGAMAIATAIESGIDIKIIQKQLSSFCGTARRFEKIAVYGKTILYDDYAHHPQEINATIEAVKTWYPDFKLCVIFQPHTYSRTKALLTEFSKAFDKCDDIFITDIYPSAREKMDLSISSKILAKKISENNKNVIYLDNWRILVSFLSNYKLKKYNVIFMGAGDIYVYSRVIANKLMNS
jgi:UDP-N-acetylmuramate--alanine ligase